MQRRLLHGSHEKSSIRAERKLEVGALPRQQLRLAACIGKPQADTIIVCDRKAQSLGSEGQPARGRWCLKRAISNSFAAYISLFPRGPVERPLRSAGDIVDPAMLSILKNAGRREVWSGRDHLAVIAAGEQPPGGGR